MLIYQAAKPKKQLLAPKTRRLASLIGAVITFEVMAITGALIWKFPAQSRELARQPSLLSGYFIQKIIGSSNPVLNIDLPYQEFYQLQNQRNRALKAGTVSDSDSNFVTAKLEIDQENIPIQLRLRPGGTESLTSEQWAYQIEVKNDDRPFGLKRFSLYRPEAKKFVREQVWLQQLRQAGGLARPSTLAQLTLNGSLQGTVVVEDEFSKEWIKSTGRPEGLFLHYVDTEQPAIQATRDGHIEKYLGLQRQRESAIALLEGFRTGQKSAEQVFDLEATAKFLAIASFWPERATITGPEAYFYYNPTTALLEPVGFHSHHRSTETPKLSRWISQVLNHPAFANAYRQERQRWQESKAWTKLRQTVKPELQKLSQSLYQPLQGSPMQNLWSDLRSRLSAPDPILSQVQRQAQVSDQPLSIYQGRSLTEPDIPTLLAQHPFLRWNAGDRSLTVQPGTWQVAGDLIIPANVQLVSQAGTTLKFEPDAILLARGDLQMSGTSNQPIVLAPQRQSWGGLEVYNAAQRSTLKHVKVERTTGGVLFYESAVSLSHTEFSGSTARDALRLIKSQFAIQHSHFHDLQDDGIDTEQSNGSIDQSQFKTIGGDAIDLSKSQVKLSELMIQKVSDKGISVGQESQLTAHSLSIKDSDIAISSLDGSTAVLDNVDIQNVAIALAAYQDRLGFSPSWIQAHQTQMQDVRHPTLVQSQSKITLNHQLKAGGLRDTKTLLDLGILQE